MNLNLGDTQIILGVCIEHGLLRNQTAYVLANAYWETNRTMLPVEEAFWVHPNDPVKMDRWRKNNLRYYPHHGRGHTQVTWLRNYQKVKAKTGADVVAHPELLLTDSHLSATAMVVGMVEGWFTGKKLSDYITLKKSNFVGARRIINGTDQAQAIAEIARSYDALLLSEGYGVDEPKAPIVNDNRDGTAPREHESESTTLKALVRDWLATLGLTFGGVLSWWSQQSEGTQNAVYVAVAIVAASLILSGQAKLHIRKSRKQKWQEGVR